MADLQKISQGIIDVINQYSQAQQQINMMQMQRAIGDYAKERKYSEKYEYDPIEKAKAMQYSYEHPAASGAFKGMSWYDQVENQRGNMPSIRMGGISQKDVVELARKMASDEYNALDEGGASYIDLIEKNMPKAKELLTGMSSEKDKDSPRLNTMQGVSAGYKAGKKEKKQDEYTVGEIRQFGDKGNWKYLGEDKWEMVE